VARSRPKKISPKVKKSLKSPDASKKAKATRKPRKTKRKASKRPTRLPSPRTSAKAKKAPSVTLSERDFSTMIEGGSEVAERRVLVVLETSNNGPKTIRAITVDGVHVCENVVSTTARTECDVTAHFDPPTRIGWEIFAGIQFPRAAVFLERRGREPELLGGQAPLKKGVPWFEEKLVRS